MANKRISNPGVDALGTLLGGLATSILPSILPPSFPIAEQLKNPIEDVANRTAEKIGESINPYLAGAILMGGWLLYEHNKKAQSTIPTPQQTTGHPQEANGFDGSTADSRTQEPFSPMGSQEHEGVETREPIKNTATRVNTHAQSTEGPIYWNPRARGGRK